MKTRLSHSSTTKYQQCPRSYAYHYVEKLRPKLTSSALLFGSALDSAINHLLKADDKDPYNIFDYNWRFANINNKQQYIPESTLVIYSNSEFDKDLLKPEDLVALKEKSGELSPLEYYNQLRYKKSKASWDALSEVEKKFYNYANWLSLRRKGHIMIAAYNTEIKPKLKSILAVQKYIEIKNEAEDKIVGFIDLIAELHDGRVVVFDLKTSSIEYEENAVLTSPQLTFYMHCVSEEYKTRYAGYIVLRKNIIKNKKKQCSKCGFDGSGGRHKTCANEIENKRCGGDWAETIDPKCEVQFLVDKIPERAEEIVLENYDLVNQGIKSGSFHRNLSGCIRAWGPCEYFKLCWKDSKEGLEKS